MCIRGCHGIAGGPGGRSGAGGGRDTIGGTVVAHGGGIAAIGIRGKRKNSTRLKVCTLLHRYAEASKQELAKSRVPAYSFVGAVSPKNYRRSLCSVFRAAGLPVFRRLLKLILDASEKPRDGYD